MPTKKPATIADAPKLSESITAPRPSAPTAPMTMREFAARIGLSKTTVSKAFTRNGRIAPETRETILRAAEEMGFSLNPNAQRLSNGRNTDQVYLFCAGVYGGAPVRKLWRIQEALTAAGLDAPVYGTGQLNWDSAEGQVKALQKLRRQRPRAIVCSTVVLPDEGLDVLRAYQDEGGTVIVYDVPVDLDCDAVVFDRFENVYQGTRFLIEKGHRDIGISLIGNPADRPGFLMPRLEGFQAALAEAGIPERLEWRFAGEATQESGMQLFEKFRKLAHRPTALFIVNESAAASFIHAAWRAGVRVPDDVSVMSNDGMPIGQYAAVPITTVTTPSLLIADTVVRLTLDRLADPGRPVERVVINGELIVRDSVAEPPSEPRGA